MSWAVLTILAGLDHGKRVEAGLTRLGYTYYNPLTFENWIARGRQLTRQVQLFPGYMFVTIKDQWRVLCGLRGVTGILQDGDGPLTVKQQLIDQLKADETDGYIQLPAAPPRFKHGQSVILKNEAGAFVNKLAMFDGMRGPARAAVLLQMLGKQVRIVVPESALLEVV
jgi:transcription antitermination factor NusG